MFFSLMAIHEEEKLQKTFIIFGKVTQEVNTITNKPDPKRNY